MPNSEPAKAQQRIISAATELFSNLGYNGVSTRNIADLADVNESSIFRLFGSKRDLFEATLDAEFAKVQLRAGSFAKLAGATDGRTALLTLLQMTAETVLQQRALVRLVHFGVLEFGGELDDIYRRHLRTTLQAAGDYLARWPELVEQRFDARITIVAFIAAVIALQDFYPLLAGEQMSGDSLREAANTCAELWHAALVAKSNNRPLSAHA